MRLQMMYEYISLPWDTQLRLTYIYYKKAVWHEYNKTHRLINWWIIEKLRGHIFKYGYVDDVCMVIVGGKRLEPVDVRGSDMLATIKSRANKYRDPLAQEDVKYLLGALNRARRRRDFWFEEAEKLKRNTEEV